MYKKYLLFFIFLFFLVIGCIENTNTPNAKVEIHGSQLDKQTEKEVKSAVLSSIIPYTGKYDSVNITVQKIDNKLQIKVIGKCDICEFTDRYEFTYSKENKSLVLKGYILEAIPFTERNKAIGIAMQSNEVIEVVKMKSGSLQGNPTVKRILPETSEKFYAPKTLISVTWIDYQTNSAIISALIDLDTQKVVQVWKSGGS